MKDEDNLISMYLDNELTLEQKGSFIARIHDDGVFFNTTVELLAQEKILHNALCNRAPQPKSIRLAERKMVQWVGRALAAVLLLTFSFLAGSNYSNTQRVTAVTPAEDISRRFVILQQETDKVEIVGSFTSWKKVPLVRSGTEGYWEVTLKLPSGEHRYSFVIDGKRYLPDPTVQDREADDFGSANSILRI